METITYLIFSEVAPNILHKQAKKLVKLNNVFPAANTCVKSHRVSHVLMFSLFVSAALLADRGAA